MRVEGKVTRRLKSPAKQMGAFLGVVVRFGVVALARWAVREEQAWGRDSARSERFAKSKLLRG